MKKVGFIGLGIMGQGMTSNLLKKGFEVTVWNRDTSKAQPVVEQGAKLAENVTELARSSEVIISMLRDDAVVREIVIGQVVPAAQSGTTFIDMSTVTPALCHELDEAVKKAGGHYIAGPVAGSKEAAAAAQLTILAGGEADVIEAQRDVLEAMSQRIIHVGPTGGHSAYLKLINNQLLGVLLASLGESLAVASKVGLDRQMVLELLSGGVGRVAAMKQPKILDHNWDTQFSLELLHKDLTQTLQAANEISVPMPILAVTRESYQRKRAEGKGDLDFAVIAED